MSADLQVKVEAIVNEWINVGFMFSAYDVTQKIRLDGDWVRHHAVRDIVVSLFTNNKMINYTKTLVTVNSNSNGDSTFVYHHPSSDVYLYQTDWVVNNYFQTGMRYVGSSTTTMSSRTGSAKSTNTSSVPVMGSCHLFKTNENRINIPLKIVGLLNSIWEVDDILAVYKNSDNTMTIEKIKNATIFSNLETMYPNAKFYYVNSDGRIRISYSTLKMVFGSIANISQFKVSISSNKENLLVEPA